MSLQIDADALREMPKKDKLELLCEFVNALMHKGELPSREAMEAGVDTCIAVIGEMTRQPGRTGRKPLKSFESETPQFNVALDRARGNITHGEARLAIAAMCHCESRHAERFLAEMKPRAERMIFILDNLAAHKSTDGN